MPETEIQDPYELRLPKEQWEAIGNALCDACIETVSARKDADDGLRDYRRLLEGQAQPSGNLPWPGACEIQEMISRELHMTTTAAIYSSTSQLPYTTVEAVHREDIDAASDVETWINIKAKQYGYSNAIYDAIYIANEGRVGPLYVGPDQKIVRSFKLVEQPQTPEEIEQGEPAKKDLVLDEQPGDFCLELRACDAWDVYPYPVTAFGPQLKEGALGVFERMNLTREDLILGMESEAYNDEWVSEMLDKEPAALNMDDVQSEFEDDGIQTDTSSKSRETGQYECFLYIGLAPKLLDEEGKPQIPDALMHADVIAMICPALRTMFKIAYSNIPDQDRPYSLFHVVKRPRRWFGEGIVSMTAQYADEMTSIVRFGINNMNLEASPVLVTSESWLTRYSKWTIAPGRNLPRQASDPVGPQPLKWDVRSQQLILPWLAHIDNQCQRLAASQGVNSQLGGKSLKAAQIHFAEAMQQVKFDLFLSCIKQGVEETFRLMISMLLRHFEDDPGIGTATDNDTGQTVTITAEQLKKNFRFLATASSDAISPAARLQKQQAVDAIVTDYWNTYPLAVQGGWAQYLYATKHRLLVLAGERNPERFIGPEPQESQAQGPNPLQMLMQQYGQQQNGNGQKPSMGGVFAEQMGGGAKQANGAY